MFNFRSTSELENFQNLILKYASKRNSYKPPAYRARNELAALDHNAQCGRAVMDKQRWNNQLNFISIMVTDILVQSKLPIDIDCFCIDRTKGGVW